MFVLSAKAVQRSFTLQGDHTGKNHTKKLCGSAMIRGLFILGFLALMPWWISLGLEQMGIRVSLLPMMSSWVKREPVEDDGTMPPAGWREHAYLAANPDVAAAVRRGALRSGYEHYLRFGQAEGRSGGFAPPAVAVAASQPVPLPSSPPPPLPTPQPAPVSAPVAVPAPLAVAPAVPPVAAETPPAPTRPPPSLPEPAPIPASAPVAVPAPLAVAPAVPPVAAETPPAPVSQPIGGVAVIPPSKPPVPGVVPTAIPAPAPILISGIRAGTHDGFARIVLDVSASPRLERAAQATPHSIGIELPNAVWRIARQGRLTTKTLSYRIEEAARGASRLVIDSHETIRLKSMFVLPPDGGRGYRVVLDVTRNDAGALRSRE